MGTREIARRMMLEGQAIGEALGVRFAIDVDKRIKGAVEVGAHKTSMLQDLERGRPMEIDALVTAVQKWDEWSVSRRRTSDAILALVRQRAREADCYPALDAYFVAVYRGVPRSAVCRLMCRDCRD